jgi:hypothetical protein
MSHKSLYPNELYLLIHAQDSAKNLTRLEFSLLLSAQWEADQVKTPNTFFEQVPIEMVDKIVQEISEKTEDYRTTMLRLRTRACRIGTKKGMKHGRRCTTRRGLQ